MKIVQVCNVGTICGGTAACAWSITRALPECEHVVLFLSRPTRETARAFAPIPVALIPYVDDDVLTPFQPDLVILHNTSAAHVGEIRQCVRLQYCHSQGKHAPADLTVACSRWLSDRLPQRPDVLYQPIPCPPSPANQSSHSPKRDLDDSIIVGRLCTPQLRKWPESTVSFYEELAEQFPHIRWEFVGCPANMHSSLQTACGGRVKFLPAKWGAQHHFHRWHVLLYHHSTLTESFGRTVAEAMLAGCLPLVDARGGFAEQIQPGETGFLCETLPDFVAALRQLTPARRWVMARAARQQAQNRFSLSTFAHRFRRRMMEFCAGLSPESLSFAAPRRVPCPRPPEKQK